MITLPVELIRLTQELHLDSPWCHLVQIEFRTSTGPDVYDTREITDFNRAIVFNSLTFQPYPFKLGNIEHNSASEIRRLTLSTANIDQIVIGLLEQYWVSVLDPLWLLTVWIVNTSDPSLTPVTTNDKYVMLSAKTDLFNVSFECQWEGISVRKILPSRRFTKLSGFPFIPRRVR